MILFGIEIRQMSVLQQRAALYFGKPEAIPYGIHCFLQHPLPVPLLLTDKQIQLCHPAILFNSAKRYPYRAKRCGKIIVFFQ